MGANHRRRRRRIVPAGPKADPLKDRGVTSEVSDTDVSVNLEDGRLTLLGAISQGLRFALGRPFTVFRVSVLPLCVLVACHLAFSWRDLAYMVMAPEDFSPLDWVQPVLFVVALFWAWSSLWGGLFGQFLEHGQNKPWSLLGGGGQKFRLICAFVILFALPIAVAVTFGLIPVDSAPVQLVSVGHLIGVGSYTDVGGAQHFSFPRSIFGGQAHWPVAVSAAGLGLSAYLLLRLAFLVPGVVSERRLRVLAAWRRTRGMTSHMAGVLCFSVPVMLMLVAIPMTIGIFATYYLYPELLTIDVRVSLWLNEPTQLILLWPTFVGYLLGVSLCCAFWSGVVGSLYQTRVVAK